jgi:hypothetical protein
VLAHYLTMLKSVTYDNASGGPHVACETINVVANDGTSSSNTVVSTIAINAPPILQLNAPTTNYTTSWTNSGAVPITGAKASPTLITGFPAWPTDGASMHRLFRYYLLAGTAAGATPAAGSIRLIPLPSRFVQNVPEPL